MLSSLSALLVISFLKCVCSSSVTLDIIWLNSSWNDPLAVCNDGTPSAYYFKAATDEIFKDYWIFHLQGGGQCYSQTSCASRSSTLKSSKSFASTTSLHGIFDGDELLTSLGGVNKVYVAYCSSDGWIGDVAASANTWNYAFRGQRIVRSALNDLITKGMITSSSTILFSGGSAGARGMMNNVDFLLQYLPKGAKVDGAFLDSAYTVDVEPFSPTFVGFRNETQEIFNRYNTIAVIPEDCAASYRDEMWKCNMGQYRMPFLQTPWVLIASQYDKYQLSNNIGEDPVNGTYSQPGMMEYAESWAAYTNKLLHQLATVKSKAKLSNKNGGELRLVPGFVHSWACYNHDVSSTSRYYQCTADGVTQKLAVELLQQKDDSEHWIEECQGFACGSGCDYLPTYSPTKKPTMAPSL